MRATHEVQVWNHKGSWRTRWYACEVVGHHPAPRSFVDAGHAGEWLDVRLADGSLCDHCNPECVRAKSKG